MLRIDSRIDEFRRLTSIRQTGQSIGQVMQWIWDGYYTVEEAR